MRGIKWSHDRWLHVTQKGQSRDLLIFGCEYLEYGLRLRLGTNCPLIGNGLWRIDSWRHKWRHVIFWVQGCDPNIFKARYFKNGLAVRAKIFSFNRAPSPCPTLHKICTKFTWQIYALSEWLLVITFQVSSIVMSADGHVTLLERELITLMEVFRLHHITRNEK